MQKKHVCRHKDIMICLFINLNHINSRLFLWFSGCFRWLFWRLNILFFSDFELFLRYDSLNTGRNRCFIWLQKLPARVLLYAWWVVAFCAKYGQEPIFRTHAMWKYEGCLVVLTSYDPKKNLLHMICIDLLSNVANVLVHPCWHWWKIGSGVLNSLHR